MSDPRPPPRPADAPATRAEGVRWSVPHPRGITALDAEAVAFRRGKLASLLSAALGPERTYLYEGEMASYPRSYVADAAGELGMFIQLSGLTEEELAMCVVELSRPERIAQGFSTRLLTSLLETNGPLLTALARSADPALRRFALEVSAQPRYRPGSPDIHLFPLLTEAPELLDDTHEEVRLAAVRSTGWMRSHAVLLERSLLHRDHPPMDVLRGLLRRLDDASPTVRAAAARALQGCAPQTALPALRERLAREDDPGARAALEEASSVDAPASAVPAPERPARLRLHLEALADGREAGGLMVQFVDVHLLRGGADVFVGTDGDFERVDFGPDARRVRRVGGQVAPAQVRELARALVRRDTGGGPAGTGRVRPTTATPPPA